ncbi:hypothetical protein M408DRAFT_328236 [Serendipita vermifera MAFF 305830]|uniref:SAP domain-containing protein n=1 Tax=Serendipita vermifera MAFF 305830 TaxID=933852 RepID=A0A0C3AEF5_SERVB|nr:hypothetical protein M408DRAFT_332601 [Serendipita vermifera MAFF 305830]KIM30722.1 hypothetical protein M408DRAFT_328236 [Serendipita vermifera MAFF 305830]
MEAKLKGMKVAELRNVLVQAGVAFDSKLTKPALIKKIMETPAAVAAASAPDDGAGIDDDQPDLPPSINWDAAPKVTTTAPTAASSVQNQSIAAATLTKAPPSTPAIAATTSTQPQAAASPPKQATESAFKAADIAPVTAEDEIARRKARAAKWGTTFVDPTAAPAAKPTAKKAAAAAPAPIVDDEKRKSREARFGQSSAKPAATAAPVDDEETRKRKAREERFSMNKKPRLEGETSGQ